MYRVNRVQAQPIKTKVVNPLPDTLEHPVAHRLGVIAVEIERWSPRGRIAIREVGTELVEVVALGAEMIENDVENHRDSPTVSRVDETLESLGSAIAVLGGKGVHAVITPAASAGKLRHRHDLDGIDPYIDEVIEPIDRCIEGAGVGERADVQFIENEVGAIDLRAIMSPNEIFGETSAESR